jgi:hypothetical protein
MNRVLTIALCALMLAGCTDTYDRSALPGASAVLNRETASCEAAWNAKDLKNYSEWQACQLAGERRFATAVKLKMDAFETYAAGMQALAADRDAKRVTDRQVRSRANEIQWAFLADCGCKPGWRPNPGYGQYFVSSLLLEPRIPAMTPLTP